MNSAVHRARPPVLFDSDFDSRFIAHSMQEIREDFFMKTFRATRDGVHPKHSIPARPF